MNKALTIRCVMDTEEDVVRDILILQNQNLMELHKGIVTAFSLNTGEMSSFFRSNSNWDQGEEISMLDLDDDSGGNALEKMLIAELFAGPGDKALFVYDFFLLWTFYLEVVESLEIEPDKQYPRLVGKIGQRPEEAPEKTMEQYSDDDDFDGDDEYLDDQNEFDTDHDDDWY